MVHARRRAEVAQPARDRDARRSAATTTRYRRVLDAGWQCALVSRVLDAYAVRRGRVHLDCGDAGGPAEHRSVPAASAVQRAVSGLGVGTLARCSDPRGNESHVHSALTERPWGPRRPGPGAVVS